MHNVLLSSVGRRVELTRAFRAAYERLGLEGQIVGTDYDWLAPAFQEVDEARFVPAFKDPAYLPTLLDICRSDSIDVIYPLNDRELIHLSENREEIESLGTRVAVPSPEAIRTCGDKWKTFEFFAKLGLPTPTSWIPPERPSPLTFPQFIKPRDGSAAENAFPIRNEAELEFFLSYVPNPIIQACLHGPEITTDVVCGLDGNVLSIVSRKRISVRGGETMKSVTVQDERIEAACREIAEALPARGPFTVQCMLEDDTPHFIEINARLGGGLPLAIGAGVDVPALLLADAVGLGIDSLQSVADTGVFMTRCDESFFLKETEHARSEGSRIRPR